MMCAISDGLTGVALRCGVNAFSLRKDVRAARQPGSHFKCGSLAAMVVASENAVVALNMRDRAAGIAAASDVTFLISFMIDRAR